MSNGTALTIGKFNGFHLGHQVLLKSISEVANELGLEAVVLKLSSLKPTSGNIFTDDEIEKFIGEEYKGIKRLEKLLFTPEFAKMTPEDFVKDVLVDEYKVKYVAVGRDFHFGKDRLGDINKLSELGAQYGFEVKVFDKLSIDGQIVSSSRIKDNLSNGNVEEVRRLLGRPYFISGYVQSGKKLGRTLGYPTINQSITDEKILPKFGVYSSKIYIYQQDESLSEYRGITNIGIRPSVDDGNVPTVETFIYDFDKDIYGSKVILEPIKYIRSERKFSGLDELTSQISKDIETAKLTHQ